ncbi:ATP synthase subunit I [Salipiger sp. PrR002]|uniref:N-ATPase subunit AtpR n=1 Tax=Salipiger sp. PrR002 TaxID=2706489 RepID=UPI0013B77318|nr:ATP synthase subunit I [Salipiger sp. PrR002]NDW00133.1 ATP synthase subunit I [Salipiger sp. PrR002]NDW56858.1 ATP synthase subunit I [Salipiger sp. PrR004]
MTLPDTPYALAALALCLGFALGWAHFASLRRVTDLYLESGPAWRALALQLGRLAVLAGVLVGLALLGALPLLAGTLGLLLARQMVLRRSRKGA